MKRCLFVPILFILLAQIAYAHQPHIAFGKDIKGNITRINDPEVSQAYYGIMDGKPDYYKVSSGNNFTLYLNILVPDIEGASKDFSVAVFSASENIHPDPLFVLDGTNYTWKSFYENVANDNYYMGPELRRIMPAGTYEIKVYNPLDSGKYALAVGETERFTLMDTFYATLALPVIKMDIFGKPWISAYTNKIGLILLAELIIIGALIVFAVMLLIRFFRNMKSEKEVVIVK